MIGYRRHEEGAKVLTEYVDNKYYKLALLEKQYTKAIDLLPYKKNNSIFLFFKYYYK